MGYYCQLSYMEIAADVKRAYGKVKSKDLGSAHAKAIHLGIPPNTESVLP